MSCFVKPNCGSLIEKVQECGSYLNQELNAGIRLCQNAPAYWADQAKTGSAYWTDQVQKAPAYWKDQIQKAPNFWWGQICAAPAYWTAQATSLVQECLDHINALAGAPTSLHGHQLSALLTESQNKENELKKLSQRVDDLTKENEQLKATSDKLKADFDALQKTFPALKKGTGRH